MLCSVMKPVKFTLHLSEMTIVERLVMRSNSNNLVRNELLCSSI